MEIRPEPGLGGPCPLHSPPPRACIPADYPPPQLTPSEKGDGSRRPVGAGALLAGLLGKAWAQVPSVGLLGLGPGGGQRCHPQGAGRPTPTPAPGRDRSLPLPASLPRKSCPGLAGEPDGGGGGGEASLAPWPGLNIYYVLFGLWGRGGEGCRIDPELRGEAGPGLGRGRCPDPAPQGLPQADPSRGPPLGTGPAQEGRLALEPGAALRNRGQRAGSHGRAGIRSLSREPPAEGLRTPRAPLGSGLPSPRLPPGRPPLPSAEVPAGAPAAFLPPLYRRERRGGGWGTWGLLLGSPGWGLRGGRGAFLPKLALPERPGPARLAGLAAETGTGAASRARGPRGGGGALRGP